MLGNSYFVIAISITKVTADGTSKNLCAIQQRKICIKFDYLVNGAVGCQLFVGNFNEVCADNTSDWVLGGFL
jgi:hypothetical protein